jgi:hypothetical protein
MNDGIMGLFVLSVKGKTEERRMAQGVRHPPPSPPPKGDTAVVNNQQKDRKDETIQAVLFSTYCRIWDDARFWDISNMSEYFS